MLKESTVANRNAYFSVGCYTVCYYFGPEEPLIWLWVDNIKQELIQINSVNSSFHNKRPYCKTETRTHSKQFTADCRQWHAHAHTHTPGRSHCALRLTSTVYRLLCLKVLGSDFTSVSALCSCRNRWHFKYITMESTFLLWCQILERKTQEQCPVPELVSRLLQIIHRSCLCHFRIFFLIRTNTKSPGGWKCRYTHTLE